MIRMINQHFVTFQIVILQPVNEIGRLIFQGHPITQHVSPSKPSKINHNRHN